MVYLTHLGTEQMSQIWNREKITELVQSDNLPSSQKERLEFVLKTKEFGVEHLHLSPDSGFVYYVELDREEVGWNVSASYPLEFRSYTWWFPIAGEVPYKGFFDYDRALEEEKKLKQKGLDTRIRVTGGYSTLGWFSDPIFSPQLKWAYPRLAGLVLHEMSHATVYIPGDSKFNESYANFVEEKGVALFYQEETEVKDYEKYRNSQKKQKESLELIRNTAVALQSIYESEITDSEKRKEKEKTIENFKSTALEMGLVPSEKETLFREKDWNNEDFIGVLRYKSGKKFFESKFQEAKGDFSLFHRLVRDYEKLSPEEKKLAMEE